MTTPTQRELAERIAQHVNGGVSKGAGSTIRKTTATGVLKYMGSGRGRIRASDGRMDSVGDYVKQRSIIWDDWLKNPIIPYNHNLSEIIGRGSNVQYVPSEDATDIDFYIPPGATARGDEVLNLMAEGIIKSASVGFEVLESAPVDKAKPWAGQIYTKTRILEVSILALPANSRATLQELKSMPSRNSSKAQRIAEARALARPEYRELLALETAKELAATASMTKAERVALAESMRNPPGAVVRQLAPANTAEGYAQRMNLHQNAVQGAASKSGHYTRDERLAIARQIIAESNRI